MKTGCISFSSFWDYFCLLTFRFQSHFSLSNFSHYVLHTLVTPLLSFSMNSITSINIKGRKKITKSSVKMTYWFYRHAGKEIHTKTFNLPFPKEKKNTRLNLDCVQVNHRRGNRDNRTSSSLI